jgi:hypothetical protein
MGECSACRWWGQNEQMLRGLVAAEDQLGVCRRAITRATDAARRGAAFAVGLEDREDMLVFADLGLLMTRPTFGCNQWEAAVPDSR